MSKCQVEREELKERIDRLKARKTDLLAQQLDLMRKQDIVFSELETINYVIAVASVQLVANDCLPGRLDSASETL